MRGVVPLGEGMVEVREVPDPHPGPGEAVVALRNAGICGSDLHTAHRSWEEIGERQNLVIGHEASGVVAEVGAGVSHALVGTRVSVYHYRGCGVCRHCLAGEIVVHHRPRLIDATSQPVDTGRRVAEHQEVK